MLLMCANIYMLYLGITTTAQKNIPPIIPPIKEKKNLTDSHKQNDHDDDRPTKWINVDDIVNLAVVIQERQQ